MSYRSDPTADRAIGNLSKEWKRMVQLAIKIQESDDYGWIMQESERFTGIYKRLLTEPIEKLKAMK